MNVSEYLVAFLEEKGIDHIFGVVGGASLWLCKAFGQAAKIKPVFTNHEQAAAMAADGWARITGKPGIVLTINGPGMTNAVTGIAQAWTDSSPLILITGNSNLNSVKYERENNIRQYGTQDVRTDSIMQPITKKTFLLERAEDAAECFEEAYRLAVSDRPGPVCIEIPINVQSAVVPERNTIFPSQDELKIEPDQIGRIAEKLAKAKRPLVLAGQGVRLCGDLAGFHAFIEKFRLPVVNSRMGIDTIETENDLFVGRAGNHGSRASHFAIQTCDVLLILGCRLAPNTTGYDVSRFSPQSYKILVEIDKNELNKYQLPIDMTVHGDLRAFFSQILRCSSDTDTAKREDWIRCCLSWKQKYPIINPGIERNGQISTYKTVDVVSKYAGEGDMILSDTGSCCSIVAQTWTVKKGQRVFISGGLSAMGYWATSMGVALADTTDANVICFVGDGSLQMNIQELATLKTYGLHVKLFVISNDGYQFVRMSQGAYQIDPPFGTDVSKGVPIPNIEAVVRAYGLHYSSCDDPVKLEETVRAVLDSKEAEVCEIFVDTDQEVCPRLKSISTEDGRFISPAYENLYPFLEPSELEEEIKKAYRQTEGE